MSEEVKSTIKKRWVIIKEKGFCPSVKRPINDSFEAFIVLLRELVALHGGKVELIAVELTWGDELQCDSGEGILSVYDSIIKGVHEARKP